MKIDLLNNVHICYVSDYGESSRTALRYATNASGILQVVTIDNDIPVIADAGPDQSVCNTTTTLEGNNAGTGTATFNVTHFQT